MLGKQWLNRYVSTDMRGSAVERSHNRQRKLDGIVAWYFDHVMESLPLMLQAALLLLGCALSRYLFDINIIVASIIIAVTSLGLIFYLFIIFAGAVYESCPYQTPGSLILRHAGPRVWNAIHSTHSAITSALRNIFRQSRVVKIVAENTAVYHPWWSGRGVMPFCRDIVLEAPLGFVIDVYHIGRAATRAFFTLPGGASHLVRSAKGRFPNAYSTLKQRLSQQTTPSHFRCISWTLQTSLDKPVQLRALEHLVTMAVLTGSDSTLLMDCFNVFVGCTSFIGQKLVVMQGLEQLAKVSIGCLFRTLHHLRATDPTSSVLVDLPRRYTRIFPFETDFVGLPFHHTIMMLHALFHERFDHCKLQWDNYRPSGQEHIAFAQYMLEIAQAEFQRIQRGKVPRWILRFALRSLSLDPPPPISVVADCLTIVAIDLECDISNVTAVDERFAIELGCDTSNITPFERYVQI